MISMQVKNRPVLKNLLSSHWVSKMFTFSLPFRGGIRLCKIFILFPKSLSQRVPQWLVMTWPWQAATVKAQGLIAFGL